MKGLSYRSSQRCIGTAIQALIVARSGAVRWSNGRWGTLMNQRLDGGWNMDDAELEMELKLVVGELLADRA